METPKPSADVVIGMMRKFNKFVLSAALATRLLYYMTMHRPDWLEFTQSMLDFSNEMVVVAILLYLSAHWYSPKS